MAIMEGLLQPIYNRILSDEFEDNVAFLKELLSAKKRARMRGELFIKNERSIQENYGSHGDYPTKRLICHKCGHAGHTASKCYTKKENYKGSNQLKEEKQCSKEKKERQKLSEVE